MMLLACRSVGAVCLCGPSWAWCLSGLHVTLPPLFACCACTHCVDRLGGGFLLVGYDLLKTHHTPGFSGSE